MLADSSPALNRRGIGLKRDNAYFLKRLKAEHPAIYADYQAGKFPSVGAARDAAGMRSPRTPLHELKNAWAKASPKQRQQFTDHIEAMAKSASPVAAPSAPVVVVVDADGRVTPEARDAIREIMARKKMRMGALMSEFGRDRSDGSLGVALRWPTRIADSLAEDLGPWIEKNRLK